MRALSQKLDHVIHEIAFEAVAGGKPSFESDPLLAQLKKLGTESWIDTGDLDQARATWKHELSALTTNNTLANQVVQTGIMDAVIQETARKIFEVASDLSEEELVLEMGFVINCKIAMRLVQAFKVKVSVELHPAVSRNIEKTHHFARRYYKICPEFFIIKVPLTPEGYLAVRQLRKEDMPINFTLGFSARQNYLAARLSNPTYVNVFLGRLNQVVVDNAMGSGDLVGEKVTLATQEALTNCRNAHPEVSTQLIGASIRGGEQVGFLAGLDVLTIPPAAMRQFLDSGKDPKNITGNLGKDVAPGIDENFSQDARVKKLWEVSDYFKRFVESLLENENLDSLSGEELKKITRDHGVDLFHEFSRDDLQTINDHGKIPKLSHWPETIALDDLMTQSALQSFTKDQDALDARIRSFL